MTQHIVILVFAATVFNAFTTAKLDELSRPLETEQDMQVSKRTKTKLW
jgi:hypothetical protein